MANLPRKKILIAAVVMFGWAGGSWWVFSQPDRSLEKAARTLLDRECLACHGETASAGLDMRKRETLLKGGKSGPAVVPGKPEESPLFLAASHQGELRMPPGREEPLSGDDLQLLREWIRNPDFWREKHLRMQFTEAQRSFWSFQPLSDPPKPVVQDTQWPLSPLDHFVLRLLEEEGLTPSPPADKRTLIRRVSYDLTGLPPTPQEIDAFLADESEKAFDNLVERLLESPHYGERWAQLWFDTVRYADSTAHDCNCLMRFAYRYRDYVVRALNQDKPYDEFVVEQLAGDLLPLTRDLDLAAQRIIATGFLMLGPKSLAEQDKEQVVMDIVDEQIDVTSRTFLGMTVACARCHDHKFDPIPTRDYYSMAGIFRSMETLLVESEHTSMWWEHAMFEIPGQETVHVMAPKEGKVVDLRVHVRGSHRSLGDEAPRGFLQIVSDRDDEAEMPEDQSGRLELARWIASSKNPLTARVMVNRLWQGHFGAGLVRTVNNFGANGARPSHPELLDWLASRFIENSWSIKAMHRLILLSATYRMQSAAHENALQKDPTNRLLWQFNRRRLDAEQLRDSILAVSGELDLTVGGSEFDWEPVAQVIDVERGLYSLAKAGQEFESYQTLRRALYVPVVRNQLLPQFQIFDFPDRNAPAEGRNDTTVAPQALYLLNDPFVRERSLAFARQLLSGMEKDPLWQPIYRLGLSEVRDEDRLRLAHLKTLGRPPTREELAEGIRFLDEYSRSQLEQKTSEEEGRLAAWQSYCQTLFSLNEFLYVN